MAKQSSIIFVTGGVRSGKSAYAEDLAEKWWNATPKGNLHYIATMQVSDQELANRIARHQNDRKKSGLPWLTWEKSTGVGELATRFLSNDIVLLDCLTNWLNNEFFSSNHWRDEQFRTNLFQQMWEGLWAISLCVNKLIIVSNEVLHDAILDNDLVLYYSELLGKLHQKIVNQAYEAILVESGTPIFVKGSESA